MLTNIVHLRKEAIPKLLGLLGNALASGDSEFILKEDNYIRYDNIKDHN